MLTCLIMVPWSESKNEVDDADEHYKSGVRKLILPSLLNDYELWWLKIILRGTGKGCNRSSSYHICKLIYR